jgi:hypothetical protein
MLHRPQFPVALASSLHEVCQPCITSFYPCLYRPIMFLVILPWPLSFQLTGSFYGRRAPAAITEPWACVLVGSKVDSMLLWSLA